MPGSSFIIIITIFFFYFFKTDPSVDYNCSIAIVFKKKKKKTNSTHDKLINMCTPHPRSDPCLGVCNNDECCVPMDWRCSFECINDWSFRCIAGSTIVSDNDDGIVRVVYFPIACAVFGIGIAVVLFFACCQRVHPAGRPAYPPREIKETIIHRVEQPSPTRSQEVRNFNNSEPDKNDNDLPRVSVLTPQIERTAPTEDDLSMRPVELSYSDVDITEVASPCRLLPSTESCGFKITLTDQSLVSLYGVKRTSSKFTCYCHHFLSSGSHCTSGDKSSLKTCNGIMYAETSSAALSFFGLSNLTLVCRPRQTGHRMCRDSFCPYLMAGRDCPYSVDTDPPGFT